MILTISQVAELKADLKNRFGIALHFHDACGGQSFSLDAPNKEVREYLTNVLQQHGVQILFSDDETHFTLESE